MIKIVVALTDSEREEYWPVDSGIPISEANIRMGEMDGNDLYEPQPNQGGAAFQSYLRQSNRPFCCW